MEFVRKNTSLPVPAVLEVQIETETETRLSSFPMEEMPGRQLGQAWPDMSEAARSHAISTLRQHLAQLHDLRPLSPGWVGSCSGGAAYDHRITNLTTCGPFDSVCAFHDFLVAPIVFAHADISEENILVDEATGGITAVLDWEMAGHWPSWWEYRKALFASRNVPQWRTIVGRINYGGIRKPGGTGHGT
ncbi:kinase-like protein [Nemania sp. NC0429]|nr:kinase-like protein [Nemania sp. NC0429]